MAAAGSVAEEVLDAADTVLEEASEAVDSARKITPRDISFLGGGVVVGVAVGSFLGHLLYSKVVRKRESERADEEIAGMKQHYDGKLKSLENQAEKKTLSELSEEMEEAIEGKEGGGRTPYHQMYEGDNSEEKPEVKTENVFDKPEDPEVEMEEAWNYEEEIRSRSAAVPYVIHRDEYQEGPSGPVEFEQFTLTYFEGDDVLCKDDDSVIEDQDEVVGLGNLSKFGHGSGDPNIVYIRNEKLKVDLEVVHSDGKYATEVHGFQEDELKHSSMRRTSPRRSERETDYR